ncbi:MAG: hypothetical protein HY238_20280 [Acidobacteria bacterium]|nr:hypothetical protein [Acidobacteriota bacterium]
MPRSLSILAAYIAVSAVYLLYLPHAMPVLDDWTWLRFFEQARDGGPAGVVAFLDRLVDNTWMAQFRIFWAAFVPVFALSFAAGFSAWPYFLLGWTAHLATALLLGRIVSRLTASERTGFAAGAIYAVFPANNTVLFWPVNNCFYYFQALGLAAWLDITLRGNYRYRLKDFALLALVVYTGEQALPPLALLLPVTHFLFGRKEDRPRVLRFWLTHAAALAVLLAFYVLGLNRMSVARGLQERGAAAMPWSPWAFPLRLLAALGLKPDLAEWRPQWRPSPVLLALLAVALAAAIWALRRLKEEPGAPAAPGRLLLWSAAGAALSYLPVALLPGIEWRYLYVPAMFLVPAGVALLGWLPRRVQAALVLLAVAYGISLTYFEMRQCWIPQSREARAQLAAVEAAAPVRGREVLIFAHAPHAMGPAPSFITGASWSLNSMLEHYTRAEGVQGARELLVNEQGELALYRRDSSVPFSRNDLPRLRVFARDPAGRYVLKPLIALPAPGGRFELFPNRDGEPARTLQELQRQPFFDQIYFPHPHQGPLPPNHA